MTTYIIEIHPKKTAFDPLARTVRSELMEAGEPVEEAAVNTQRLYRITGSLTPDELSLVAETLLVDPVVESAVVKNPDLKIKKKAPSKKVSKSQAGWVLDVWPKSGVTDPVGETVLKGLRDLGLKGKFQASSAQRYVFPKVKNAALLKNLAKQVLANELIHDITLSRIN